MELFSINCTTCNSRLKVRSRAAIGQILACPKCSSMVLVEPPEGWTDEVLQERELAAAAEKRARTKAATPAADSESVLDDTFDDAVALLSGSAPSLPTSQTAIRHAAAASAIRQQVAEASPSPTKSEEPEPAVPSAPTTSESLPTRLLIAGAVTSSVLLIAVVGFSLFAPSGGDEIVAVDESVEEPADPTPAEPTTTKTSEPDEVDPAPEDPIPVEPEADPPEDDPDTDPTPEDVDDPVDPTPEDDPPGFATDDPRDDEPTDTKSLLDDLRNIGELIGDEPLVDVGPIAPPKRAEEPLPRPAPRTVDVAQQLKMSVIGIDFDGITIADYLQFVSDMSTIPITVEPEALLRANLSPGDPINVQQTATTVGGILAAALKPHGLTIQPREGHLWITTLPAVGGAELSTVEYPVDDLVQSADELTQLRSWITTLVAPKSWTSAGGPASLQANGKSLIAEQTGDVHFDVLMLLEKLRVARGNSPRTVTDPSRLSLDTRMAAAQPKLATPISLNFVRPTRFVSIVKRIGEAADVHLLIDWEAIAKAGWNPDAELTFSVEKQPLDETLGRLLNRMDLTYRVVNDSLLQITTPLAMMEQAELEFYSIADLVDDELDDQEFISLLKSRLGEVFFFDNAGAIHYDAKSKCLLVRLPQPQQIALTNLLTRLRADK